MSLQVRMDNSKKKKSVKIKETINNFLNYEKV